MMDDEVRISDLGSALMGPGGSGLGTRDSGLARRVRVRYVLGVSGLAGPEVEVEVEVGIRSEFLTMTKHC